MSPLSSNSDVFLGIGILVKVHNKSFNLILFAAIFKVRLLVTFKMDTMYPHTLQSVGADNVEAESLGSGTEKSCSQTFE